MKTILLTQIDGKLPNLALMKLSHWHKNQGDIVYLAENDVINRWLVDFDKVYGSAVFNYSNDLLDKFKSEFPDAILGGTGTKETITVEDIIGSEYEYYDYSIYPEFKYSLGFTSRGCRLNCKFCVVPKKEGRPRFVNSIQDIWCGGDSEKKIILLDNDFFGQPKEQWIKRCEELIEGKFKVSLNQGINTRLIDNESASWLAKLKYYDDQFKLRRIYTAWDKLKDEEIFFKGMKTLEKAGVKPQHLLVYMLIGFDKEETWDDILYRFNKIAETGAKPYPMNYARDNVWLRRFARWGIRRYYMVCTWDNFRGSYKSHHDLYTGGKVNEALTQKTQGII